MGRYEMMNRNIKKDALASALRWCRRNADAIVFIVCMMSVAVTFR